MRSNAALSSRPSSRRIRATRKRMRRLAAGISMRSRRLAVWTARAVLGARKSVGFEATDRAIALGGDRALFTGLAALLRLSIDPADSRGALLADAAVRGTTPTMIDRIDAAPRDRDGQGAQEWRQAHGSGAGQTAAAARADQDVAAPDGARGIHESPGLCRPRNSLFRASIREFNREIVSFRR